MSKRTETHAKAKRHLENIYKTRDTEDFSKALSELLQFIGSWKYPAADKNVAAAVFSNLLQNLATFSNQHVQGVPVTRQSVLKSQIEQALSAYFALCFPLS